MEENQVHAERGETPAIRLATAGDGRTLSVGIGHASRAVAGKQNEDCFGVVTPVEEPDAATRGIALAIADGVSGNGGGRFASETTIKSVLRDFYATPAHWHVSQALDRVLRSLNDWLLAESLRHPEVEGMVSTLSMLLLADSQYFLVHVGDSRVYRKRGDVLKQLTTDHTWQRRDMRHVLRRAVGLDTYLVADFADGEVLPGDVFVMLTDGVWEVLGDRVIREVLETRKNPDQIADELTERSIRSQVQYMGRNDATAIVAQVQAHVL
ncbi:MAG: PP2C family serine/threonine-protein phosphatase [Burkholderiales bacterium]